MLAAVADQNPQRRQRPLPQHQRGQAQQGSGQASRHIVRHVVDPRRRPAEIPIAVVPVAEHRIKRIHGPIDHRSDRAGQERIEQRRRHPVDRALRHALHRRPSHAGCVQTRYIAADDVRHRQTGGGQIAVGQGAEHATAVTRQVARGNRGIDHQHRDDLGRPGIDLGRRSHQAPCGQAGQRNHEQRRQQTSQPSRPQSAARKTLQPAGQPADPPHRMWQPTRVAEDQVECGGREYLHWQTHHHLINR
jgi:hypothetical protein